MLDFQSIINRINSIRNKFDFTDNDYKLMDKMCYKLNNISAISNNIDSELLDVINSDCNNLLHAIESIENGELDKLSSLSDFIDNILSKVIKLVDFSIVFDDKSSFKNRIKNYKETLYYETKKSRKEIDEALNEAELLREDIVGKKSEFNDSIKKLSKKMDDVEIRQNELAESVEQLFSDVSSKCDLNLDAEKTRLQGKISQISDDYIIKMDNILKSVEDRDKKLSDLFNLATKKGKIGEYSKYANNSNRERIVWQIITVFLFIVSFCIAIHAAYSKNFDKFILIRYIVSVVLMSAAAYTAKQASNSRKDSVYYRKQQLELSTIDSFLDGLDKDTVINIKTKLSTSFFGQAKNTYSNRYDETKGFSIKDIKELIKVFKK